MWTIIDLEDLERVLSYPYSWHATYNTHSNSWYAVATTYLGTTGKTNMNTFLNAFILNPDGNPDICVDHIHHDTLDNRKINLRSTETIYNTKNRKSKNSNNKTGYRNVAYIPSNGSKPYIVQIMIDGKNTRLKSFSDIDEAGIYAEEMRRKYYKDFAGKS